MVILRKAYKNMNTQKFICEAYGFKEMIQLDDEVLWKGKKQKIFSFKTELLTVVDDNTDKHCAFCGNIHSKGYTSTVDAKHLLETFVSDTYNEVYSLGSKENFICEYCGFSTVAYGSESKMVYGRYMVNALIVNGSVEKKSFKSDKQNELYGILKNPPKPPFVILINSRGSVIENLVFTARATVDSSYIIVNYGLDNLMVNPAEVFECIETARVISKQFNNYKINGTKRKLDVNSDFIWNRANDVKFDTRFLKIPEFVSAVSEFLSKFNRPCRIVGKMVLEAYLQENKEMKEVASPVKVTTNLLDLI